jgi:CheY-like chemotaxis protein
LVVANHASILGFIEVYFKQNLAWEVTPALSAAEALQACPAAEFDLLLADLDSDSRIDGIDIARRLRESQPDIAVLLMAGDHRAEETARQAGFPDLIMKPFDLPSLGRRCSEVVGRSRQE